MRLFLTILTTVMVSVWPLSSAFAAAPEGGAIIQVDTATDIGGVGIRLLEVPVATQNDPRAQSYIVDNLPPGTTIERRVEVSNTSASSQSVMVYAGSASIESGSFVGNAGAAVNELTTWTSLSDDRLQLAAGATADILVTIAVPEDAAEGETYATVWAEVRSAPAEGTTIINASRVGIRMYVSVGPGNGPAADFSIGALQASRTESGEPQIAATVLNTGGRALDMSGELTLSDGPSGLSAGPFPTETALTLAPGSQGDVVITLGVDLPNGPWQAALTLRSGLVEHDVSAKVTFPEAGESVAIEADNSIGVWPFALGTAVLLAMLAIGLRWQVRNRRALGTPPTEIP